MNKLGQAVAAAAAKYDTPSMNARSMLLSPDFWSDVVDAMGGIARADVTPLPPPGPVIPLTSHPMTEATLINPTLMILDPPSVSADEALLKLTAMGRWFGFGSRIVFDGEEKETRLIGPDKVETTFHIGNVDPRMVQVFVRTGAHETEKLPFTFLTPKGDDDAGTE